MKIITHVIFFFLVLLCVLFCFTFFFETVCFYIAQAGLELEILLSQSP
jgi:hypothetical protein